MLLILTLSLRESHVQSIYLLATVIQSVEAEFVVHVAALLQLCDDPVVWTTYSVTTSLRQPLIADAAILHMYSP